MSGDGGSTQSRGAGGSSKLHNLIFIAMAVGLVLGLGLHAIKDSAPGLFEHAVWWLDLLGPTLFIGALKMIIAPLILASIVAGVTSLPNVVRELLASGLVSTKESPYWKSMVTSRTWMEVVSGTFDPNRTVMPSSGWIRNTKAF